MANANFAMETEQDGVLPFLDALVKQTNNKLAHGVYRKKTYTDRYLNAPSTTEEIINPNAQGRTYI
ncbi:hypothetical protein NQ318_009799 [Aromia moschata]|uniref:Uncharacterized protein n=1 Tax=Aromia moschata TaxID=1265417 RepID=A0AAV8XLJ4_9CUCU|nr:hypothetical protein NQ318_009799 [Aromia moschata]